MGNIALNKFCRNYPSKKEKSFVETQPPSTEENEGL